VVESDPRSGIPRVFVIARLRPTFARIAALSVVAALAYSGWRDVPHSIDMVRTQHRIYAGYTEAQRARAFGTQIPIDMGILDFWRDGLQPGDRYWIQMPPEPFATHADKRYVARSIAHVYLLPAIEVARPADATVVLTWDADPATLHLHYGVQCEAGLQLIFVSRVATDGS
jgi:hypothetical protein